MRIAVLSDIHANLPALDAVLAAAGDVDAIWHLGDVVGYGPDPDGVVERLRDVGALGVRGNHDAAACGGSEIDWFNPEARRAMEWTRAAICPATLAVAVRAPRAPHARRLRARPRQPARAALGVRDLGAASRGRTSRCSSRPIGLHGHTHLPVAFVEDDGRVDVVGPGRTRQLELGGRRALVNPGSVGQPRDGDPDASYMVLDPEAGRVSWHRVAVRHRRPSSARCSAAGLPASLSARLSVGL